MRYDHDSMLPERAFSPRGGRFGGMTLEGGGKGGSAPPAPDYTGAAQAQATSSKETTNMANYANRPTINTPWGSQSWTQGSTIDPGTGQAVTTWTQNTNLTPESQRALDSQLAMQQGRSDIANSLMPSAQQAITKPIDYNSFSAAGQAPTASNFQSAAATPALQNIGNTPTFNQATSGPSFSALGDAGKLQTSFSPSQQMPGRFSFDGSIKNFNPSTQGVQGSLNTSGVPGMPQYDSNFVQNLQNQALDYMRPDQEHQQSMLQSKLANQGITAGSEAYNTAMRQMADQQSRDKYQALNTAMNQGSQMFNSQLAANNQGFNQALNSGNFANAAQNQDFSQQNAAWQNQLAANGQRFNQANQGWNNNLSLGNNSFNQALQGANFANSAIGQQQGLDQNVASFNNAAAQNQYNNANQANQYNNQLAQNAFANQNTVAQFNNTNAQNNFANAQTAATFNNQNMQNQFAQQQNIANYQNVLRQQQIAEAQQRQLQPLNNINALLTGQQVGMPQMPSFNANQAAQPVNYLGAAQMQGNYNLQNQQMQNASASSTMGGIGSLLGTAGGMAMAFSDKRLKRDITFVKKFGKLNWYRYRYVGSDTWHEGVLAHEVKKVKPEAVVRHSNGYDMVNYGLLGA